MKYIIIVDNIVYIFENSNKDYSKEEMVNIIENMNLFFMAKIL